MKKLTVLSLFDGISCGRVALDRIGINVDNYYASEIDKYAISISNYNWPNIIRLGDINEWRTWNIDWSSIDLILAGSPCQGFSFAGKQLNFDDPRSKLFFVFVDILNHVKQQNPNVKFLLENVVMKKIFSDKISEYVGVMPIKICSSLLSAQKRKRLYWHNLGEINQPNDKHIYINDILEPEVDNCLLNNISLKNLIVKEATKKGFVEILPNTCVDLTFPNSQTRRGRKMEKKSNCLMSSIFDYGKWNGLYYRKLTPVECERLQTLPDNYTYGITNRQRYKCLGNGWTVDVICHILNKLKE